MSQVVLKTGFTVCTIYINLVVLFLTLRAWVTVLGPAQGMTVCVEKRILLFNAEPWVGVLCPCHHFFTLFPVVRVWKHELLKVFARTDRRTMQVHANTKETCQDGCISILVINFHLQMYWSQAVSHGKH